MTGEISFKTNVNTCSKDSFYPRTQNKQILFLESQKRHSRESDGPGKLSLTPAQMPIRYSRGSWAKLEDESPT